jgi:hypothetical protein
MFSKYLKRLPGRGLLLRQIEKRIQTLAVWAIRITRGITRYEQPA